MKNEEQYLNNPYQLYGTRRYTLEEGFGKGVSCIDAKTSAGLSFTAVCDRALDISQFSWRGVNLTFLARQGEAAPAFYDAEGAGWMRSFFGGLLTSCGPMNIGRAGKGFGLHDRFTNTPAVHVCDETAYGNDILLKADVDFGVLNYPKLRCRREIRADKHGNSLTVTDVMENCGFRDEPLCLLYHTNYGYPLLSEDAEVFIDSSAIEPYDAYSRSCADKVFQMEPPSAENGEKNYFHTMNTHGGLCRAFVRNPSSGIGVFLEWSDSLPIATHCRFENPGDYFLAVEPCNTVCAGREEIERREMLPVLRAGESKTFVLRFTVLEGAQAGQRAAEWKAASPAPRIL